MTLPGTCRNPGTSDQTAQAPPLSLRDPAGVVAIRPPASRRLARPARGARDLPPSGQGLGCTHQALCKTQACAPRQGCHDLPPPGEGGRQRRPDEGWHPPRPESPQPNAQVHPCPLRTRLPIIPPVLPTPHPTRLRRATWNCGIPCHRQGIISNGASRLPHRGKVMGAPTKPASSPEPPHPLHPHPPSYPTTQIQSGAKRHLNRPLGDITRHKADITARRAISPAVRRISPPAGRYYPPPGGYHRRVSATISRNLCAAVPVTPSARSQASNAWPSRFRPFSR